MDSEQNFQRTNLFIKNLDAFVDDNTLRNEFSQFGTIKSAKVMTEGGKSKGFGFVAFSTSEEAHNALANMNGRLIGEKFIYISFAQKKEERKIYLDSMFSQRSYTIKIEGVNSESEPRMVAAVSGVIPSGNELVSSRQNEGEVAAENNFIRPWLSAQNRLIKYLRPNIKKQSQDEGDQP